MPVSVRIEKRFHGFVTRVSGEPAPPGDRSFPEIPTRSTRETPLNAKASS
jgi:hypothetical protein